MRKIKELCTKLKSMKLRQRMFLIYLIGAIIPLLLISMYSYHSSNEILLKAAREADLKDLLIIRESMEQNRTDSSTFDSEQVEMLIQNRAETTLLVMNGEDILISNQNVIAEENEISLLQGINEDTTDENVIWNKKKAILTAVKLKGNNTKEDITLVSIQTYRDIFSVEGVHNWEGILFLTVCIIFSIILVSIYFKYFTQRLDAFRVQIHKAAAGDFNISDKIEGNDEITELFDDLNTVISNIQHLATTVYNEQVQKEKLNSRQKEVEFKMLASQINPHFIYNTLEVIRMKARCSGESEIEELVKMLAKIMRRSIQAGDTLVTLKSEVELVEYYLKIQQYRFGERIGYHIDLKCDIDHLKIMPLIIQPIVENAFVHGLEVKLGKGEIRIVIEHTDRIRIHVIDNGIGMSKVKLEEITESLNEFSVLDRSHIGLSNVNQRIKLLYGLEYGIYIESKENTGTTVIIELPEDIRQ